MRRFTRFLTREPAGRVLLALLGEAQHNADTAQRFIQRYAAPRRVSEREMIDRDVARGELPVKLDADAVLDSLLGPIVLRALLGAKIPRAFLDDLLLPLESRLIPAGAPKRDGGENPQR